MGKEVYEMEDATPDEVQAQARIEAVREAESSVEDDKLPPDDDIGALGSCDDIDKATAPDAVAVPSAVVPEKPKAKRRGAGSAAKLGDRSDTIMMICPQCHGGDLTCTACGGLGEREVAVRQSVVVKHRRTPCCAAPWTVDPKKYGVIACSNCKLEYKDAEVIGKQ